MSEQSNIQSNTYLTFHLDEELYGLNIQSVREVLEFTSITRVPRTASFMRGVINVRGHAVPVMDLRRKFDLHEAEQTIDTCIIIVEVELENESTIMGALVDGVQEVLEIAPEQIEPPPQLGSRIRGRFITGIGKLEEQFVILLNVQELFSQQELEDMASAGEDEPVESGLEKAV